MISAVGGVYVLDVPMWPTNQPNRSDVRFHFRD